ncbi:hypothetical protein ES705_19299 [subsurface metagenome]
MAKQSFIYHVFNAMADAQSATDHLESALEMHEAKVLKWNNRQRLRNTRRNLSHQLAILRKFLLTFDPIFHPDKSSPGFNVKPSTSSQDSQEITKSDNAPLDNSD